MKEESKSDLYSSYSYSSESSNSVELIEVLTDPQTQKEPNVKKKFNEDDEEAIIICKVCMSSRISLIFIPCRHACVCDECYDKLGVPRACPICRTFITRSIKVIFP